MLFSVKEDKNLMKRNKHKNEQRKEKRKEKERMTMK